MESPALTHLPPRQWRPERKRRRGGAGNAAVASNGQRGSGQERGGVKRGGGASRARSKDGGDLKGPRTARAGRGERGQRDTGNGARLRRQQQLHALCRAQHLLGRAMGWTLGRGSAGLKSLRNVLPTAERDPCSLPFWGSSTISHEAGEGSGTSIPLGRSQVPQQ